MPPPASTSSRRVPPHVWVPVILACALAGVIASELVPIHRTPAAPRIPLSEVPGQLPVAASRVDQSPTAVTAQASRAMGPPHAGPASLPTGELDLPSSAPRVADRTEPPTNGTIESAPPTLPNQARARVRAARDRAVARARRPRRTAQRLAKPPATASAGFKNVPIIGPVLTLFQ